MLILLKYYKERWGSSDLSLLEEPAGYQLVGKVMAYQGYDA